MQVIKSIYAEIIYESSQDTIIKIVEEAVSKKANLQGADLQKANLQGANLQGANLLGANLRWADLQKADLQKADLQGANLRWADLQKADLQKADLQGANLQGANLLGANLQGANLLGANLQGANLQGVIQVPIFCKWPHGITDGMIHIGCEKRSIDDWDDFFKSDHIIETLRNTEEFKQIQAVYLAYRAYLIHLNS